MTKLIEMVKNDRGRLSTIKVFIVICLANWIITWDYLVYMGKRFDHFETVTLAVLVLVFGGIYNKQVDGKLISIKKEDNK